MNVVNQKNFVTGLLYTVVGAAVALGALNYELGSADRMGPGYFPFGLGLALAFTGLCVLLSSLAPGASPARLDSWPLRSLTVVLLSIVLFGILLEPLGLIVAVPVLLGVSSLAHPQFSWRALLLSIAFLVPLTWAVFILLLGLQIPLLPSFLMP